MKGLRTDAKAGPQGTSPPSAAPAPALEPPATELGGRCQDRFQLITQVFLSLGSKLSAATSAVEAARAIYASADLLWHWDGASLDLYSAESDRVQPVLNCDVLGGQRREVPPARAGAAPTDRMRRIMRQGAELILDPAPGAHSEFATFGDTSRFSASMMYVPLRRDGRPVGILSIQSYTPNAYTPDDLRTLQALADYCGGALDRIRAETAVREANERLEQRVLERTAELQALNAALQESKDQLRRASAILQAVNEGTDNLIAVKDRAGKVIMANPAMCRFHGKQESELVGTDDLDLMPDPEQAAVIRENDRRIMTSGQPERVEETLEQAGRRWHCLFSKFPYRDAAGEVIGIIGIGVDITVRKNLERELQDAWGRLELRVQERTAALAESEARYRSLANKLNEDIAARQKAQEALRASEERYRTLAECSPDAIFILDREIKVEYVNSTAARLWGRSPGELIGLPQPALFPPEIARHQEEVVRGIFASGKPLARDEAVPFPTGTQWIEVRLAPLKDAQGAVASVMGVCRDITQRKRAEQQLTEALDLNQKMLAAAGIGIGAFKATGECVFVNPALARTVGGGMARLLKGNFRRLKSWRDSGMLEQADAALASGEATSGERFIQTTFGKRIWLDCHMASFISNGEPHLLLMGVDVSERKEAEQALKLHSWVLQSMAEGVVLIGPDGRILFANPALEAMFGYKRGELLGQKVAVLNCWSETETRQFNNAVKRTLASEGASWHGQYANRRKDGTRFYSEARVSQVDLGGRMHWVSVQQDITERRSAEETQRRAERLQKALLDNIPDPAWLKDAQGRFLACNEALARFYGLGREQIIGKTVFDCIPGTAARMTHEDKTVMQTRRPWAGEAAVLDAQGRLRWMESIKAPLCNEQDEVIGTVGIARDITEHKQAESLLRSQRELGVSLSLTSDLTSALRSLLKATMRLGEFDTGGVYLRDERSGGMDLLAHEGMSAAFLETAAHWAPGSPQMRLVERGKSVFGPYRRFPFRHDKVRLRQGFHVSALVPLCHDGRAIGALGLASHVRDEIPRQTQLVIEALAAQAAGAIARIRAEASRHRLERQLLEVTDREQARIGQDIHDGLCQRLVSLAFDANSLAASLLKPRSQEARTARRIAAMADEAITESRQLARGLFPVRLASEGLISALEELARTTRERWKVRCHFQSKGRARIPSDTVATHLYRIAQEAVTNAIKHGNPRLI
ncbi:MAG TPA: PAS domain S-box protein, partial [Candidatus Acidoferrum sp.]|nr:PAS domain S-box protein [Candidatus Acidoferrum sp.]